MFLVNKHTECVLTLTNSTAITVIHPLLTPWWSDVVLVPSQTGLPQKEKLEPFLQRPSLSLFLFLSPTTLPLSLYAIVALFHVALLVFLTISISCYLIINNLYTVLRESVFKLKWKRWIFRSFVKTRSLDMRLLEIQWKYHS